MRLYKGDMVRAHWLSGLDNTIVMPNDAFIPDCGGLVPGATVVGMWRPESMEVDYCLFTITQRPLKNHLRGAWDSIFRP